VAFELLDIFARFGHDHLVFIKGKFDNMILRYSEKIIHIFFPNSQKTPLTDLDTIIKEGT